MRISPLFSVVVLVISGSLLAQSPMRGELMTQQYFEDETGKLEQATFAEIETLEDWEQRKAEYRRQLLEMLGLDPMPARTPLNAEVTHTHERDGVIVENVHFQSRPGLYVTANLYRPSRQDGPLPAILYVCGHGGVKVDGVSLGNKTHYQHHGAWFARNGYVCLTIDTVQLGEIEGIHHGTYREKMWWWNNRGYSSAGVEAFNCIRSLDYLSTRDEVDPDRIGVTGRSGGGAYSWWIAAIDERIAAAVPVAGITSLRNHVVDGCVEGHCDCMYMVNTYRWDFPMVAALVAPRPLLISNSDKDRIFPLDGVVDVHRKVRKIYELYDATDKLGLQITEGPHKDTQELRIAAFRWMNRFLRSDTSLIEDAAEPVFEKQELKVFDQLPTDELVTSIHESFVPKAEKGDVDVGSESETNAVIRALRDKTFRGWPKNPNTVDAAVIATNREAGGRVIEFLSQDAFRIPVFVFGSEDGGRQESQTIDVTVVGHDQWKKLAPIMTALFPGFLDGERADAESIEQFKKEMADRHVAFVVPRGIGPTACSEDERSQTHQRRRYMLLGQTLDGMRIYDVVLAFRMLADRDNGDPVSLRVRGSDASAMWALYASLYADGITSLDLENLPLTNRDAPDLLNVSRVVEIADVLKIANQRLEENRANP